MTPVALRLGTRDDAVALAALAMAVWPAERFHPAQIARAMAEPGHWTVVATDGPALVGFAACFTTRTAAGAICWEIDLLAVHPTYQGRGIGRRLVAAGTEAGGASGATAARALVVTDNVASQRAFAAAGFTSNAVSHTLYLTEHADARALAFAADWHHVPVVTFGYAGCWLEPPAATPPPVEAVSAPGDLVGILIPHDDSAITEAAASAGFMPSGNYHFWQRAMP